MKSKSLKVLENEWIPLPDGRKLAARIWLPLTAKKTPVPAILEYLPYRKHDGTTQRDESTYPTFAEAGYAGRLRLTTRSAIAPPVNTPAGCAGATGR